VLVGNNDIGKSNFLKALNLFFNGETEVGVPFNFKNDFCSFAQVSKKKASQIVIELTFTPPPGFREERDVIWRKVWRREGLVEDDPRYSDRKPLESRKKIGYWLAQVNYSYVPAIKGQEYFSKLLADLHDVLAETIEEELKIASGNFINKIRDHTKRISKELFQRLGFESRLQIPTDLSVLFEVLDFETSNPNGNISLKLRGDGIKVRHIPIILKFISEQRNFNKRKGAIKSSTIWGYEEPENNLELSRAFEHANDFIEYSSNIQILITTHSPAFYSLKNDNASNTKVFIVKADENNPHSSTIAAFDDEDITTLDKEMGLLPFVTPHIKSLIEEKESLLGIIKLKEKELEKHNSNVLFVEGKTDKDLITKAIEIHDPSLIGAFEIMPGGGYEWVADMTISWFYSRKSLLAVALFDQDGAGITGRDRVTKAVKEANRNFRLMCIPKVPHLRSIFNKGIRLPFAIEDLFPEHILRHAKEEDWLEFKTSVMSNSNFNDPHTTFEDYCRNQLNFNEGELLYLYKIKMIKKDAFVKYVTRLKGQDVINAFEPLKYLVTEIGRKFGLDTAQEGLNVILKA
jgi:hypothetical protein